ncbi:hypothetical protein VCHA34P116_10642 [Vibrio chagasii]|nr:hypothetical protein VCHA35O137_10483 [Vibrio chagasii]CAH6849044.1 hypothetical protein VCHA32P90_10641 [Vibrio chagasii]CAH6853866.1 hypothetical protein VCHA34P116_10642 [Vibrio chagasii]CAH7056383.1 hypothetical protein VCHA39P230_10484 [Vibrio chagasii]CAH7094997.1 hypothetical protein VCHA53O469_10642 [Vibrio chagasii]
MVKNVISNIYTMGKNSITTALNEKAPKKAATAFTLGGLYAAVGGAILGVIISVSIQVNILEWLSDLFSELIGIIATGWLWLITILKSFVSWMMMQLTTYWGGGVYLDYWSGVLLTIL